MFDSVLEFAFGSEYASSSKYASVLNMFLVVIVPSLSWKVHQLAYVLLLSCHFLSGTNYRIPYIQQRT